MALKPLEKVFSKYGAPMGRVNTHPVDTDKPFVFFLEQVPLDNGGYDKGGAYWGLRCLQEREITCTPIGAKSPVKRVVKQSLILYRFGDKDGEVHGFIDAFDRTDAKQQIQQDYINATFYK